MKKEKEKKKVHYGGECATIYTPTRVATCQWEPHRRLDDGALIKVGYGNENGARLGRVALEEAVLQRRGVGAGETMLHGRV